MADSDEGGLSVEIGRTGLREFSGLIYEERLRQLVSPDRRNLTYREMGDNDPIAGAVLFAMEMLLRQVDWDVSEPEVPSPTSAADTQFVRECLQDLLLPFKEYVSQFTSFIQYGWDWHEIVFKRRLGPQPEAEVDDKGVLRTTAGDLKPGSRFNDGRWGWHKFAPRSQDSLSRWIFDDVGEVVAMVQTPPPEYRDRIIPLSKSLHFRTTASAGNPEGKSVFRKAYRPWYFKKVFEEIQAVGVDRDLAGLPVLGVPADVLKTTASADNAALRLELEKMLRNVRRGDQEGVMLPLVYDAAGNPKYSLNLLSSGGRRQFDLKALLEYYDQRIAMMTLADVLLLGHEAVGSFALADSKTNMMATAVGAWLDMIADQFNRRAIPQLLRVNGMPFENPPLLTHGDIEHIDLDKIGTYVQKLAQAGFPLFPSADGELEKALLQVANLPGADTEV